MRQKLKQLAVKLFPDPFAHLDPSKKQLIDFAYYGLDMRSFADLGAVWNVDAGYTFYAMERHNVRSAVIVDTHLTPAVLERQKMYPGLKIIKGNFGQSTIRDQIGKVDGVFFFDTLLHQVKPDWDEVLGMYAGIARIFLILNQQYTNFREQRGCSTLVEMNTFATSRIPRVKNRIRPIFETLTRGPIPIFTPSGSGALSTPI